MIRSPDDKCLDQKAYYEQHYASAIRSIDQVMRKKNPLVWCIKGPQGVGKRWLASWMVRKIHSFTQEEQPTLWDAVPVSQTPLFSSPIEEEDFGSSVHPDDWIVQKTPSIGDVRQLLSRLSMTPCTMAYRTVVLCDMHTWNASCLNAMLKVLESPPQRTIFILTTAKTLPATIQSRCYHVVMNPTEEAVVSVENMRAPVPLEDVTRWMIQGCFQRQAFWHEHESWAIESWKLLEACKTPVGALPSATWIKETADLTDAWLEVCYVWGHRQYFWGFATQALLHWDSFWTSLWTQTQQAKQMYAETSFLVVCFLARIHHFFAYCQRQAL